MEVPRLFILPPPETVTIFIDWVWIVKHGFEMCLFHDLNPQIILSRNQEIKRMLMSFIFQGFWKAISSLMDCELFSLIPQNRRANQNFFMFRFGCIAVVWSKVLFASPNNDLSKLINKPNLFKAEGGKAEFQWKIPVNYLLSVKISISPFTLLSHNKCHQSHSHSTLTSSRSSRTTQSQRGLSFPIINPQTQDSRLNSIILIFNFILSFSSLFPLCFSSESILPQSIQIKSSACLAGKDNEVDCKRHLDLSPEQEQAKAKEIDTRTLLVARFLSLTQLWLVASEDGSPLEKVSKILSLRALLKVILQAQYLKLVDFIFFFSVCIAILIYQRFTIIAACLTKQSLGRLISKQLRPESHSFSLPTLSTPPTKLQILSWRKSFLRFCSWIFNSSPSTWTFICLIQLEPLSPRRHGVYSNKLFLAWEMRCLNSESNTGPFATKNTRQTLYHWATEASDDVTGYKCVLIHPRGSDDGLD
ncbi:hypothetical protein VP01_1119g1 [Puccinia sorghi]|uniref:Uncharacterized protein n=1 Tax=Puccinia sorghi TaxID=27349 RepID=A0A0L6VSN7_9BASI|nr:hypothetical protein VP01_1119g1 [Puccinia sorghi]